MQIKNTLLEIQFNVVKLKKNPISYLCFSGRKGR